MKLSKKFKRAILQAIRDDGTLGNDGDWWTGYTDPKGRVFDINVYNSEFNDALADDEVAVCVYDCFIDKENHWQTDYEDSPYEAFVIKRSEVVPLHTYTIEFRSKELCAMHVLAHSESHAEDLFDERNEAGIDLSECDSLELTNEIVYIKRY